MTLLNSCQVLKSLACEFVLFWRLQLIIQLNRFLALQALVEQSRYMYSHIWSKIPNIIELGQI